MGARLVIVILTHRAILGRYQGSFRGNRPKIDLQVHLGVAFSRRRFELSLRALEKCG